ncbi:MAG: cupin domain-containing protein, partial [Fibrobacteres bacterium]|nr:cupin domain-containing protein [Fibrobacterota bacterium]
MESETKFRYCGKLKEVSGWHMKSHRHLDFHEIIVVLKGTIETELGGTKITGTAGNVLFYPAGVAHEESAIGNVPLQTFFIGISLADTLEKALKCSSVFDTNGRLRTLAQWMHDLSSSH